MSFLLLIAILIPAVLGLLALRIPFRSPHALHVYMETTAVLTTVVVWILLLTLPQDRTLLCTILPGFSLQIGADGIGRLYAGLVSLMWPVVLLYAFAYMGHDARQRSFFAFYILTYAATLGISFSANLLTLFLFFELMSLSTLPLVAHHQDAESLLAARKYAAYLFGGAALALAAVIVSAACGQTGSFQPGGDLASGLPAGVLQVVYLLGFFGFGIKAAVFPFHTWLPTVSCAPTPVTALLHAVAVVNTGVFSVIRLTWYTFGPSLLQGTWVQFVCLVTAAFTLLLTSVLAVRERHIKRRLAWSTVSNLSYMLFGILLLTPDGFAAGTAHLVFHSLTKITLFLCIGSFMHETGKAYLSDANGVGKQMPRTFVFYTISALSLVGIPMFCCFISKWRLLTAGAAQASPGAYIGIGALIASAFLCAVYGLSVSARAFFPVGEDDRYKGVRPSREGGWRMLVPIGIFTAAQVFFGLWPGPLLSYITRIAEGLL